MQQNELEGRWREPGHLITGDLTGLDPGKFGPRTHTAIVVGNPVATIRAQLFGRGFTVNVPSWVWAKSLDGSAAEKLGIGETALKSFTSLQTAKQAVKYAVERLPNPAGK